MNQLRSLLADLRHFEEEPASVPACPLVTKASVRVMRSHDYCHFEVVLGSEQNGLEVVRAFSLEEVDLLRKAAARLADKAVAQFIVAKEAEQRRDSRGAQHRYANALRTPANERTPEEKAIIKFHQDKNFAAQFDYDYEDDWTEPAFEDDADMDPQPTAGPADSETIS